jgi:anti-anti-sigma regulatory factor
MEGHRQGQLLETVRDLEMSVDPNALCESLAIGFLRAGWDRCEVIVGVEYEQDRLTVGEIVAVQDVDRDGQGRDVHVRYDLDSYPVLRDALYRQDVLSIESVESDSVLGDRGRALVADLGLSSFLVLPMTSGKKLVGCVLGGKRSEDGFTPDDVLLYRVLAGHAAAAIESARMATLMEEQDRKQKQLEKERERLHQEMIIARERLISELSAPLIPITEHILVLPLIGSVDSARAQLIMESLLNGINSYDANVVIVDVTGVPLMDTGVANHLMRMTDAASLVGARTVLVGITPQVAQTIVELGVDLSGITTLSNLQGGVEYALRLQGQHITSIR